MWRFAAGLPFRNFARFRFGEVDRELERFEARRLRFAVDRAPEEREARFLRRRSPPPSDLDDRATPIGNIPIHEFTTLLLLRLSVRPLQR